jgi:soluble lytic murein transglycosylase
VLGNRSDWQSFDRELPSLVQDDLEIRCYAWLSRLARSDSGTHEEAKAIWLEPRELPESCHALANKMIESGRLNVDDVWRRLRVLFEAGQLNAARRALVHLPATEKFDEKLFSQAATAPKKLLASPPKSLELRATREMVLFAVVRLARTEPEAAVEVLRGGRLAERLPAEDAKYLWGTRRLRRRARLMPEAHRWYALADVRC